MAAARSTSMPARPSSVGSRSTWLVGVCTPSGVAATPGPRTSERDADGLVVGVVPLLHQAAVGTDQVAVVGGEDDHGVLGHARLLQRLEDAADGPVDQLVQVVVEPPVGLVGRLLVEHGRPRLDERLLAGRPPGEGVRLRRRLGDGGQRVVVDRRVAEQRSPSPPVERDVVRVDEGRHGQPRPVAAGGGQLGEELDHLLGEDAVAHRTPQSALAAPCGSRPIQPEKP